MPGKPLAPSNQADQCFAVRVEQGKTQEVFQAEVLSRHGFTVVESTIDDDMFSKIDRWIVMESGERKSLQIKSRNSAVGVDFLLDGFEPYLGLEHADTRRGRDNGDVCKADYVTERIGNVMYLVDGVSYRMVESELLLEWKSFDHRVGIDAILSEWYKQLGKRYDGSPYYTSESWFNHSTLPAMRSQKFPGAMVRVIQDRRNYRPKLLMFIPPATFEASTIRRFEV